MLTRTFRLAFAALAFSIANWLMLTQPANAAANSITVPDFAVDYWTPNLWQSSQPAGYTTFRPYPDFYPTDNALGIFGFGLIQCTSYCPANQTSSLSAQVNGLIQNHQYALTFYTQGYFFEQTAGGVLIPHTTIGPVKVSLGSAMSGPITVPGAPNPNPRLRSWEPRTVNFTYTDSGSSALLTFYQTYVGVNFPSDCFDCVANLWLASPSMTDVTPVTAPLLKVQKALGTGGRINNADQFKLSILNASTSAILNSASTSGSGSTVTGGVANITADTSTAYKFTEEMELASSSKIAQYGATLACSNANTAGTQIPSSIQVGQSLPLLKVGDDITCTITNTAKRATLQVRQMVLSPVPPNLAPPFTFSYTGNNGWSAPAISNQALNLPISSNAIALTATNTNTTVFTSLPDARWFTNSFSCTDLNAPGSGNPTGVLAQATTPSVTVPAIYVRAGAALRCSLVLGHLTP